MGICSKCGMTPMSCRCDTHPPTNKSPRSPAGYESMNKFDQLVDDLNNGDLTFNQIQIAMRAHIKLRKTMPNNVKNLLCGQMCEGGSGGGLIGDLFGNISNVIGAIELAYRRGLSEINDDS